MDSLYRCLDQEIAESPVYVAKRQATITKLMAELENAVTDKDKYALSLRLYDEYKAYVNDSALYFLERCVTLAERMGEPSWVAECRAKLAFQCSNTGMFDESLFQLRKISPEGLDINALRAYYKACTHVYGELAFYAKFEDMRSQYRELADQCEEKMYEYFPLTSPEYMQRKEQTLMAESNYQQSKAVNDEWLRSVEEGSHAYALVAFFRYMEYRAQQDTTQMMRWLAESALADVRNAVMDQGSMWELANMLMTYGDIDRAYRYISFGNECATRFGTRLRSWQISPIVTAIDKQYREYLLLEKQRTWLFVGAVSMLALLLLASLLFVLRQRKRLSVAHEQVKAQNTQLSALNTQLQDSNSQLSALNAQLSSLNAQLAESNHVKEEYVGRFLRQCSLYIDKMDEMRRKANRMVKNREYEQLYKQTRSQESKEKELEELYVNFDDAFLHLFPQFVEDFNALLKPEEQIVPEEKGRLSTGLRIFALIRLGITDSSKIADFLHYSVNTIYNYRARIKNGAASDRENFEKNVRKIGTVAVDEQIPEA